MFCRSTGDYRLCQANGNFTQCNFFPWTKIHTHKTENRCKFSLTSNIIWFWFSVKPCAWILARVAWLLLESIKPLLCHTWLFCKSCLDERSQWSISNNPTQKLNNQANTSIFQCWPQRKQCFGLFLLTDTAKRWLSNLALLL